jgi:flagellar motor protein MotB
MKLNLKKSLLTALMLCCAFQVAWADGWKLTDTKVNGTGGRWENNQKVRIDCSYKKGVFQFERKVTNGTQMDVYSSKATFNEPQKSYAPGEDISVRIVFSEKGPRLNYSPYAKVTVNGYPATDASGRNQVTPPETATLMSKTPSSGAEMTIVYTCNGMEAIYTYAWDGEMVASASNTASNDSQDIESTEATPLEEVSTWEEESVATESNEAWETFEDTGFEDIDEVYAEDTEASEATYDDYENDEDTEDSYDETLDEEEEADYEEWDDGEKRPIVKYIIVIGIAAILIALILFVFNKKNKKTVNKEIFIDEEEEPVMETPKQHVCPNCGAPVTEGSRFCEECGTPLQGPKSTITYGLTILLLVALLQGCGMMKSTESPNHSVTTVSMLKNTNTKGVKTYTLSNVDSKTLSKEDTKQLDALAREIKAMDSYQVSVIGHADNTGTSEVNEAVAVNRARMVADYLKKKGVKNITSSGESYNHPVAGNDTASGRAKNRRVEIYVSTVGRYNPYR